MLFLRRTLDVGLQKALDNLCKRASQAIADGHTILQAGLLSRGVVVGDGRLRHR